MNLTIIKEGKKILRTKTQPVKLPVDNITHNELVSMYQYLLNSQDPEYAQEHEIRAGVGLAAPQVNINKRMFVIAIKDEVESFNLFAINPVIIKKSPERTYLNGGEGCLSVDRETEGVTIRCKEITFKATIFDMKTNEYEEKTITLTGYLAIVFQHEYDHLDGKLFCDKLISEEEARKRGIKPLFEIE